MPSFPSFASSPRGGFKSDVLSLYLSPPIVNDRMFSVSRRKAVASHLPKTQPYLQRPEATRILQTVLVGIQTLPVLVVKVVVRRMMAERVQQSFGHSNQWLREKRPLRSVWPFYRFGVADFTSGQDPHASFLALDADHPLEYRCCVAHQEPDWRFEYETHAVDERRNRVLSSGNRPHRLCRRRSLRLIMGAFHPALVRTQDTTNPHPVDFPNAFTEPGVGSYDHSDHYYGAMFAQVALQRYDRLRRSGAAWPQDWIYNGYNVADGHLRRLSEPMPTYKQWMYYYYALDDYRAWPGSVPMSFATLFAPGSHAADWTYYEQATWLSPSIGRRSRVVWIGR